MLGCSGGGEGTVTPEPVASSGGESDFGFDEALAAARERMPDGLPMEVEHEVLDGAAYIEVELITDGAIRELFFDPQTGEVAREGDETLDAEEQAALPSLTEALRARSTAMEDGLAIAREHHSDAQLREVELIWADGQVFVEVEIDDGGAAQSHRYPLDGAEQPRTETLQRPAPSNAPMEEEELIE